MRLNKIQIVTSAEDIVAIRNDRDLAVSFNNDLLATETHTCITMRFVKHYELCIYIQAICGSDRH